MLTLVCVPGLGDDESTWQPLWREPSLDGIDHVAYTVPGMGGRLCHGERVEDVAEDLSAYISKLSRPVVLVGHSLGGVIGTIVTESPPENVRGLVNIEGNLTPADCGISALAAEASDFPDWFAQFISHMPARYARALKRTDPRAFRAMAEDLVRLSDDMGNRYAALDLPKLVIYGSKGYADSTQDWIRSHGVDAVRIEGAGHWVHEDAPSETALAIMQRRWR